MDAIVVGGGNTLNMLGIWKYQGIDKALQKAFDKGIILSGGSAGSICWFLNGVSDARPVYLSKVDGLKLLPYSHCPHYNDPARKTFYHKLILDKKMKAGYACDEHAGILFTDSKVTEAVSINEVNHSYFIHQQKGIIQSTLLKSRILISKNALDPTEYKKEIINKQVKDYPTENLSTKIPLQTFILIQNLFANGKYSAYSAYVTSAILSQVKDLKDKPADENKKNSILSTEIRVTLTYDNLAAIVCKNNGFYSLWYFYRDDKGTWKCGGEDIGGETLSEAEITFREKAKRLLNER